LPSRSEDSDSGRERVYIALGSNLGDRDTHLRAARKALASLPETSLIAASSIEETAPLGGMQQPPYLNQMVVLETGLEPRQMLAALQSIEQRQGRQRTERWGPRTLDLDIVRFGNRQVADSDLIIPHPELPNRDFWRRELAELSSDER
jgi:2-amino-4-hydroxy-6-hydroxymethyldihydropteridine diphosphokinase